MLVETPPPFATEAFVDAAAAVARLEEIYERNTRFLRDRFEAYVNGGALTSRVRACYPFVRMTTSTHARLDSRLAYGFVAGPGVHETSVTRPDIFRTYLTEQIELLVKNHGVPVEIGESNEPIPIHFAYRRDINIEAALTIADSSAFTRTLRDVFDTPDLAAMDDAIADGTFRAAPRSTRTAVPVPCGAGRLLAAPALSLHRHRSRAFPEFRDLHELPVLCRCLRATVPAASRIGRDRPRCLCCARECDHAQCAAWRRHDRDYASSARHRCLPFISSSPAIDGITLINIGTGPSNARNVTDHVAVLRPHAWLMVGHCAGLRNTQRLGDYVLAHGYVREDHVLDHELPLWVPIPALAEMQVALEEAVGEVTGLTGFELKRVMRTGTVASVDNRNWEISGASVIRRLSQSRAVALDMESAAIAANGYRFRVPYGTLLCVSDKPLHGEIKLAGMASEFYRRRVGQHLEIGLKALERLKQQESERLHSRKLRSFAEVAFQ